MSSVQAHALLKDGDDGRLWLSGELSIATVPELLSQQALQGHDGEEIHIDLQGVQRADSAGVALLIEWQRQAGRQQKRICFHNTPAQMLAIARLSGVDELLSLS